jgi:hypothetical protein
MKLKDRTIVKLNSYEYQVNFIEQNNSCYQYVILANTAKEAIEIATAKYSQYKAVMNNMYASK